MTPHALLHLASTPCLAAMQDAGSPDAIGWLVVTLAAGALAAERILALIRGFRRQPPIEQEFDKFVTKECCDLRQGEVVKRVDHLEQRMDRVERQMTRDKEEIIARIDDRLDAGLAKVYERIERLDATIRKEISDILRALGRAEGRTLKD